MFYFKKDKNLKIIKKNHCFALKLNAGIDLLDTSKIFICFMEQKAAS